MNSGGQGRSYRRLLIALAAAAIVGWPCMEGQFLSPLDALFGFETTLPRLAVWAGLAVLLGVTWALILPEWWYLAPFSLASLDLVLMVHGFTQGGASLWPIAVAIRVFWMGLVVAGAAIGHLGLRYMRHKPSMSQQGKRAAEQ
jgi:hypothetical protein